MRSVNFENCIDSTVQNVLFSPPVKNSDKRVVFFINKNALVNNAFSIMVIIENL